MSGSYGETFERSVYQRITVEVTNAEHVDQAEDLANTYVDLAGPEDGFFRFIDGPDAMIEVTVETVDGEVESNGDGEWIEDGEDL